jgi:hypothetical protein
VGTLENLKTTKLQYPTSGPRFEPKTSRLRSKTVTYTISNVVKKISKLTVKKTVVKKRYYRLKHGRKRKISSVTTE